MKWYTFNDNEDEGTVNMILDHNITPLLLHQYVKSTIEESTKTWNNEIINSVRLITVDEILKITGNLDFDITDSSETYFYFDSNSEEKVADKDNPSKYSWLYNNTYYCVNEGCEYEDNAEYKNIN